MNSRVPSSRHAARRTRCGPEVARGTSPIAEAISNKMITVAEARINRAGQATSSDFGERAAALSTRDPASIASPDEWGRGKFAETTGFFSASDPVEIRSMDPFEIARGL